MRGLPRRLGDRRRRHDGRVRRPELASREPLRADEVGPAAAFLSSPLGSGITGTVLYVDKGFHCMGAPADALPRD